MSDLFDEAGEAEAAVPAVAAEEAAPARRRPGRPRKTRPVAEGEKSPKRVTIKRKPKVTVKAAPAQAEAEVKESPAEAAAPAAMEIQEIPAETIADEPVAQESNPESDGSAPVPEEADAASAEAEDNGQRYRDERFDRNGYRQNRRDKHMRNNSRGRKEEYPPEVNLDEHPDAPQLFISVLTALQQIRKRWRRTILHEFSGGRHGTLSARQRHPLHPQQPGRVGQPGYPAVQRRTVRSASGAAFQRGGGIHERPAQRLRFLLLPLQRVGQTGRGNAGRNVSGDCAVPRAGARHCPPCRGDEDECPRCTGGNGIPRQQHRRGLDSIPH